jgi:perosamine synthetase
MIPISIPYLYEEDKQLAIKAIQDGFIANGKQISEFEEKFASYCNRKYGVTCSNGTVALYLAIKALNLPEGSEVILPSMTIMSCLTAIVENDLTPVFCDINPTTWNVDIESVRNKITPNTSALIVVDTYGLTVNVDEINKLKQDYPNIKVIEDASEAHGSNYRGIKAGSVGDISTFSFYANKIITTGEGGMVLTDDEETYQRLLMLRNLNFTNRKKYIHSDAGWNFRLTNLQCCLGLGQLQNIDKTIEQRRRIAERYNSNLRHVHIQLPFEDKDNYNVYWYYSILIESNHDKVLKALDENGIDYRHFFYPLHLQPFVKTNASLPISQYVSGQGLILPTFTELTNNQIDFISEVVLKQL